MAMSSKSRFLLVALTLCAAALIWILMDLCFEAPAPGCEPASGGAQAKPEEPETGILNASEQGSERAEIRPAETPAPKPGSPTTGKPTVTGLVKDIHGLPVGGVTVSFEFRSYYGAPKASKKTLDHLTVQAGDDGAFTMARPKTHGYLVASSDEHATLLDCEWTGAKKSPEIDENPEIIVALRRKYSGTVVYDNGAPVLGKRIVVRADAALILSLRPGVQHSAPVQWVTKTDKGGRFAFAKVPWSPGTILSLAVRGFDPIHMELPDRSDTSLQLKLVRTLVDVNAVAGKVVWESRKPVNRALVYFGKSIAITDASGQFTFKRDKPHEGGELFATTKGWSGRHELVAGQSAGSIVLALDRRPLTIAGRVVDNSGRPVSNAVVFTRDGHPSMRRYPWPQCMVDKDGRFALSAMLPGKYEVFAVDNKTLEAVSAGKIEAGTQDLEIVMLGTATMHRVAGRILTLSGDPLPGVRLLVGRSTKLGKSRFHAPLVTKDVPKTDAKGRFAFDKMCVEGTYLIPSGPKVRNSERIQLDPMADLTRLEIRLPVACRFQVLMRNPDEADAVGVLDANGRRMSLLVTLANTAFSGPTTRLRKGHSAIIQVDERATTLVLLKNGKEVRRHGVTLDPKKTQVIRL